MRWKSERGVCCSVAQHRGEDGRRPRAERGRPVAAQRCSRGAGRWKERMWPKGDGGGRREGKEERKKKEGEGPSRESKRSRRVETKPGAAHQATSKAPRGQGQWLATGSGEGMADATKRRAEKRTVGRKDSGKAVQLDRWRRPFSSAFAFSLSPQRPADSGRRAAGSGGPDAAGAPAGLPHRAREKHTHTHTEAHH